MKAKDINPSENSAEANRIRLQLLRSLMNFVHDEASESKIFDFGFRKLAEIFPDFQITFSKRDKLDKPTKHILETPLLINKMIVGVLRMESSNAHSWTDFEKLILCDLADYLSLVIRDRRSLERARESEQKFRQLAENIQEVFWMTDPAKNQMIYVSPAYESIWNRSIESLYENPMSFIEAIHPVDRERVIAALPQQASGTYKQEYRICRPDGKERWIRDRAFPIRNDQGKIYRIAGLAEDISDQKAYETKLKEVQSIVVSNAKMAALGEMAGGVAHEINNPLMVILGKLGQLQKWADENNDLKANIQSHLDSIAKMVDRIAKIIKGLRAFSRNADLDPMVTSKLSQIVTETLELCLAKFNHASIELRFDEGQFEIEVDCRPVQISQVLLNLLSNAFDAVQNLENKWIEISARKVGKDRVQLAVSDSGRGIAKEILVNILDPFFTTKEVGKGTGLGLPISQGIIEAHQGRLWYDEKSSYTRFIFELPCSKKI
ncbi:MAG: hypothetical protein COV44_06950 [Deltaproteobacteria bacterium CG11_big_fil_rev_8_21_14_0_20_45_16]|nr:MAG: hypothetical protein COV44_06950 [Deltaproteobacteria bacterium CG11_big_fil_rev_8_21_14_0_20_45_16]